jgi:hypothetical protein
MFNRVFLVRMAEQALVSFLLSFGAVVTATDASLSKTLLVSALAAGARAVYGVFAKSVNDPEQPQVK